MLMAKAKVRSAMDGVWKVWRIGEPSSLFDAPGKVLGAGCTEWDFAARRTTTPSEGNRLIVTQRINFPVFCGGVFSVFVGEFRKNGMLNVVF